MASNAEGQPSVSVDAFDASSQKTSFKSSGRFRTSSGRILVDTSLSVVFQWMSGSEGMTEVSASPMCYISTFIITIGLFYIYYFSLIKLQTKLNLY